MPDFSIVIPVYNAEKTLHRCLDSLLTQTYSYFEVHMIENGSTDSSADICREYASKDPRFVLHSLKENGGPSVARNIGIDCSAGKFIAFIDSDDYVQADYLESLLKGFETAEVVFLGYNQVDNYGNIIKTCIPYRKDKDSYHNQLIHLHSQDNFGYTWVKAFRRDVIGKHRFSQQLNLMEDELFVCEILTTPRKIAVVSKPIYNYVTGNTSSLMGRTHPDYCRKVDIVYKAWCNLLENYANKKETLSYMADGYVNRCMYYCYERNVDIKEFCGQLAESTFFAVSAIENRFTQSVKNKKYKQLYIMKSFYNIKNKLARLLKR